MQPNTKFKTINITVPSAGTPQRDFLYSSFGGFGLRVSPGQLLLIGLEMHHIAGEQCRWTGGKIWEKTHKWTESWITRKWGKSFFGTKTTRLNIRYARDMPSTSIQYRPNYFQVSWQNCPWNILGWLLLEVDIMTFAFNYIIWNHYIKGTVQLGYGPLLTST